MIFAVLLLAFTCLGVLAVITVIGVARIEHVHPPAGRMIAVDGGRLQVRIAVQAEVAITLIVGKDQPAIDTLEALVWFVRTLAHVMRLVAHELNVFANSLQTFTDNLKPAAPPAK